MSADALPRYIDVRKLTQQQGQVKGVTALSNLPRLAEFASDKTEQPVEVLLDFFRDEEGRQCIRGQVSAQLVVTCQRCLKPMVQVVASNIDLVIVRSDDENRSLSSEQDGWQVSDDQIELATLLEDEILLAMPIVALHDDCQPQVVRDAPIVDVASSSANERKVTPFSVLAELKKHQG